VAVFNVALGGRPVPWADASLDTIDYASSGINNEGQKNQILNVFCDSIAEEAD
jgi:hypothetical protein